eukprot:2502999-Pleurochrysis_carterae.AAC.1
MVAGASFLWCTLAALSGTIAHPCFARSVLAAEALVRPVPNMPDFSTHNTVAFSFGAMRATALAPHFGGASAAAHSAAAALSAADAAARALRDALLADTSAHAGDFALWAERIQPTELVDLPSSLLNDLPAFPSAVHARVPLTRVPQPLCTTFLPRAPPQRTRPEVCPKSATDLLLPSAKVKLDAWLCDTLADLASIKDDGQAAVRSRPRSVAIGQAELHPWARGTIWDFTSERNPLCGSPLDYDAPLETHLNVDFLRSALADYPDQSLLSYLLDGVRLDADVELQTVLVPHLASLPPGYEIVRKEIRRLHSKGW